MLQFQSYVREENGAKINDKNDKNRVALQKEHLIGHLLLMDVKYAWPAMRNSESSAFAKFMMTYKRRGIMCELL